MRTIRGVVQHYPWGDHDVIPRMLGLEPDGLPWAELWLGTHERAMATLDDGRPLRDEVGDLPYLLKVLAAAEPLSLQTHPNAGVYGDPNPKPELLCAITEVEALCGIRPAAATAALLAELGLVDLAERVTVHGSGSLVHDLYRRRVDAAPIVAACADSPRREAHWVRELDQRYPGEPSVAATLLLNLVHLEPGQALRLDAGNLHAYLHGAGIELMGPSDNVVRGGLTAKEVDVDLLLATIDTSPMAQPVLPVDDRYDLPAAGVTLLVLAPGTPHTAVIDELGIDESGHAFWLAPGDEFTAERLTWLVTASGA
jgi:mannose-6-phosphate isomerase